MVVLKTTNILVISTLKLEIIVGKIMNKIIPLILSVLVSFVIGYHLYPVFNERLIEESSSDRTDLTTLSSTKPSASQSTTQTHQQGKNSDRLANRDPNSTNKNVDVALKQQRISSATLTKQVEHDPTETNIDDSEQLAALKEWSEEHKRNLTELVNNNLPAKRAQALMESIMKDNPFLNDVVVKQDAYSDEEWSYKMKATITNLISQHSYGQDIEVLSLTCKQLTCEMIVRQLVNGSWFEVYPDLMRYFLSNQYIIQTRDMKQFRFKNGNEYLFYQHFIFTK